MGEPHTKDMKYLMKIINADPTIFAAMSKDERNQIHRECGAWHEELERKDRTLFAAALQPAETATTLCHSGGKLTVTDGPFAESKEVLGGFEVLECADLDEAMAIAKSFPALKSGMVVELLPLVPDGGCMED